MKRMAEAKQKYDDIPIPEELSKRVMLEIKKAEKKHNKRGLFMKKITAAAAAVAILFIVGINSSKTFAQEISNIPVIGSIARIVTFRSYETKTEDTDISVDIPSIELISEELNGLEKGVNEEIYAFCKQYADEALLRAEQYKKAFLETGGTEEEWAKHDIKIKVWYEVKTLTDEYLSLVIMGNDSWNHANNEARYYSFDIKAGKWLTLKEIFGDSYKQSVEENIRYQIKQKEEETGMEFWDEQWNGVDESTKFYVNSNGNPVIIFEKYEIAPGTAGSQEFEIIK